MFEDEDDDVELKVPEKKSMPFQYQLMQWALIALTVVSLTAFFIMIVF